MNKLLPIIVALSLTGCITFKPLENIAYTFPISDPDKAYGRAVDCASRVLTPSRGQFFNYYSEKYNKFLVRFLVGYFITSENVFDEVRYGTDAVLRYTTSEDGKRATIEVTGITTCDNDYCIGEVISDNYMLYKNSIKRTISDIEVCMHEKHPYN